MDLGSGPLQFTESSGHWAQLGSPDWEALPSPSHAVSRSAQMLQKQSTADTRVILQWGFKNVGLYCALHTVVAREIRDERHDEHLVLQ